MLKRILHCSVALVVLLSATIAGAYTNVILIMVDDLGVECIDDHGGTSYQTPQMTRMGQAGVRFHHAHSQPICTPSRVQIMTGKYNVRNYVRFAKLDQGEDTFGNPFKQAGYATCVVGKWQLGGNAQTMQDFGFDRHFLWRLGAANQERYWSPTFQDDGVTKSFTGEYGPKVQQDFAKAFILENSDQPFFLYYPMMLPHSPFQPTPDSAVVSQPGWDPADWTESDSDIQYFGDMLGYLDKQLGDMLDFLEANDLAENTLVIFTSDNGTSQEIYSQQNGLTVRGGKGRPTEAGTHVPMYVSQPGTVQSNLVINDIVDFSDIYATMMDAAGITIAPELAAEKDGISFLPKLMGQAGTTRDHSYCWYMSRTDMTNIRQFVQDSSYKLYSTGNFYKKTVDRLEENALSDAELDPSELQLKSNFGNLLSHYSSLRPDGIPYSESMPFPVPGSIPATFHDYGQEGVSYHDTTDGNSGGEGPRTYDVDIGRLNGNLVVTDIANGEWLEYEVDVAQTGSYSVKVSYSGTSAGRLHLELDEENVTGPVDLPATGSSTTFSTVTATGMQLTEGVQKLRAVWDQGGMAIEAFEVTHTGPPVDGPDPVTVTIWEEGFESPVPVVQQADVFYLGGAVPTAGFAPEVWAVASNPAAVGVDSAPGALTTLSTNDPLRVRGAAVILGPELFTRGVGSYVLNYDVDISGGLVPSDHYGQVLIYSGNGYESVGGAAYKLDVTKAAPSVISFEGVSGASAALLADSGPEAVTATQKTLLFDYSGGEVALVFASQGSALAVWDNLSIAAVLTEDQVFATWVTQFPSMNGQTGALDDPDGDGANNFLEFALGGMPNSAVDGLRMPSIGIVRSGELSWAEYTYEQRLNAARYGLSYTLQVSPDLEEESWTAAEIDPFGIEMQDSVFEQVVYRFDLEEPSSRFFRLMIEED